MAVSTDTERDSGGEGKLPVRGRVPPRLVIATAAGLWLCYFVLVTLRGLLTDFDMQGLLIGPRLIVTIAGIAITLTTWPLLAQLDTRHPALRGAAALAIMLPAALLIAAVNQKVFSSVEEQMMIAKAAKEQQPVKSGGRVIIKQDDSGNVLVELPDAPAPPAQPGDPDAMTMWKKDVQAHFWLNITEIALGRYFLLLAWAALYIALGYAQTARAAALREGEFRRAAKSAELRSLRYQVNPHFLFNTLNSLSALVLTGKTERAEKMIQTISTFYRRSLADDPSADVPLEDEVRMQALYLEIEAVRFPQRLVTRFDIPDDLRDACVPGMLLQPLVENSVKYAVQPVSRQVTLTIAAREEQGRLVLSVADDGPGVRQPPPDQPAQRRGCGIGIQNVRDRLQARFGDDADVVVQATATGHVTIIHMPILHHVC